MSYFPVVVPGRRAFRKQVKQPISVELSAKGRTVSGHLQTISVNGGRALLSHKHEEGALAHVRLRTKTSCISGVAQMLKSESVGGGMMQQAFRLLALDDDDYQRLQAVLIAD